MNDIQIHSNSVAPNKLYILRLINSLLQCSHKWTSLFIYLLSGNRVTLFAEGGCNLWRPHTFMLKNTAKIDISHRPHLVLPSRHTWVCLGSRLSYYWRHQKNMPHNLLISQICYICRKQKESFWAMSLIKIPFSLQHKVFYSNLQQIILVFLANNLPFF